MRLTNASVAALTLPAGKDRLLVYDDELKGFGVRLSAGGSKQWIVQYRTTKAETRRETIGKVGMISLTDARKRAADTLLRVRGGEDPRAQAKRARQSPTIGALVEPYLEERKGHITVEWHKDLTRYLQVHFQPLHKIAARELTRADVHKQLQELKRTAGATTANRAQTALSRFYNWLVATDVVDVNVIIGTEKPFVEKTRDRVLKPAELAAIWHGCRQDDFGDIVKLLILTGQRREEVAALPGPSWTRPPPCGACRASAPRTGCRTRCRYRARRSR